MLRGMDAVFKALADPTRRSLLDELFKHDGQTLGALERRLPITRFGVMKHLRVLEQAGLVVTSPASSSTRRCFITPKRDIGRSASRALSDCPSRSKSRSSSSRRVGSASALKTSSMF